MTLLDFKVGDDRWKKYREKCKDLFWFNYNVLGRVDLFPFEEETHLLPLRFAGRQTGIPLIDNAPIMLAMWPRECGKTTTMTEALAIQRACFDPDIAILVANEVADNAADFVFTIEKEFENNDILRNLFPEVIPPNTNDVTWSRTRFELVRQTNRPEPTVDSVGVGGSKVGRHYDLGLIDDIVAEKAYENARRGDWSLFEHANRWVDKLDALLSNSAKPFPQLLFTGTHWYANDTYEHIEKTFGYGEKKQRFRISAVTSTGKRVTREVYRVGDLAVMKIGGIENGVAMFPKIWSEDRMQKARERDPEWFACNVLNSPTSADVRTFQDEWLRYWKAVDDSGTLGYKDEDGNNVFVHTNQLHRLIAVDPAFSSGEEGARTAMIVLGTDMTTGKHLVLDAVARKSDPKDTIVDVMNLAQTWGVSKVYVELAGQQLAYIQWLEKESQARGVPLVVERLKPGGRNKDLRIEALVIPFKFGHLLLNGSQSVLIDDEFKKYRPGAKNRDLLDALAYALEQAPKPRHQLGQDAKTRAQAGLESYRSRLKARRRR